MDQTEPTDLNEQIAQRRAKLAELRAQTNAFPNDYRRDNRAGELHANYGAKDAPSFESTPVRVKVAGRMMTRRIMGKASFCHLQDMSGQIQLYLQREALGEAYEAL